MVADNFLHKEIRGILRSKISATTKVVADTLLLLDIYTPLFVVAEAYLLLLVESYTPLFLVAEAYRRPQKTIADNFVFTGVSPAMPSDC